MRMIAVEQQNYATSESSIIDCYLQENLPWFPPPLPLISNNLTVLTDNHVTGNLNILFLVNQSFSKETSILSYSARFANLHSSLITTSSGVS